MPNRLSLESSPYLRQHANNPVDWHAWNNEALEKARAENKPILLSVGYSACHWCHVMEHECFENADIAKQMNEGFINIKVDREERPDIDQIYQNVAQLMTRSGGWPLTVFLTPDLRPFFGGTYFPPEDRYGRPGFPRILEALSQAYRNEPQNILANAAKLTEAIAKLESAQVEENLRPTPESMRKIVDSTLSAIDWKNGGFGDAPKFPHSMNLALLWRYGSATGFGMAIDAVYLSLNKMADGGIYDHLGGGFHRYSVDERWEVPHFEKMLYDNAVLLKLYSEVLLSGENIPPTEKQTYLRVVRETTAYILREMHSPEGAFYATQDADSEGEEGKFFVWNPQTLREYLGDDEARAFEMRYGVSQYGNFEHSDQTVLAVTKPIHEVASSMNLDENAVTELISSAQQKLLNAREKRVRPGRDEKIIAGWNGLMISGLAWAARALELNQEPDLANQAQQAAARAFEFVLEKLARPEGRLFGVYKDAQARFNAYLDDYAFLAMAALDLSRFASEPTTIERYLSQSRSWINVVRTHFVDRDHGGFYFTSDDHEKLIQRPKTLYDQSIPSGNAIALQVMLALAEITADTGYLTEADEHIYKAFATVEKAPLGMGEFACTALLSLMGSITVSGNGVSRACAHAHVFQKVATHPVGFLICHNQACEPPIENYAQIQQQISMMLKRNLKA